MEGSYRTAPASGQRVSPAQGSDTSSNSSELGIVKGNRVGGFLRDQVVQIAITAIKPHNEGSRNQMDRLLHWQLHAVVERSSGRYDSITFDTRKEEVLNDDGSSKRPEIYEVGI